jgi:hypothetical protein
MASIRIKGLDKFHMAVTGVKKAAHEMRTELQKRQAWYNEKSDYWKFGRSGQAWAQHLFEVARLVELVEQLEPVGHKYNISFGRIVLPAFDLENSGNYDAE